LIKLDTNGSNPTMLEAMLKEGLIDYVAMDIKATAKKYQLITGMDYSKIQDSIHILREYKKLERVSLKERFDYEFRTTVYSLLDFEDIKKLGEEYRQDRYILQQYRPVSKLALQAYPLKEIQKLASRIGAGLRH